MTENALVTTAPQKEPLSAGQKVAALVPQTLEQAFRVSQAMAISGLAPATLNTQEKVLVAILAGAELGLPPFQSLQSFAVINGRPTLWGDALMAIVLSQGFKVDEWREGEGDEMICHAAVTRPDTGETIERTFSVADAKKAGLWNKQGPWQQYPRRMLQMRARSFCLRDGAADVLRGFQLREEVEDYQPIRDVTPPAGTGMRSRLEQRGAPVGGFSAEHVTAELDEALEGDAVPAHDAETGEIIEAEAAASDEVRILGKFEERDGAYQFVPDAPVEAQVEPQAEAEFDIEGWATDFNQSLAAMPTEAVVEATWKGAKADGFVAKLKAKSPGLAKALAASVNERLAEIRKAAA